jgi:hypothetical protein
MPTSCLPLEPALSDLSRVPRVPLTAHSHIQTHSHGTGWLWLAAALKFCPLAICCKYKCSITSEPYERKDLMGDIYDATCFLGPGHSLS